MKCRMRFDLFVVYWWEILSSLAVLSWTVPVMVLKWATTPVEVYHRSLPFSRFFPVCFSSKVDVFFSSFGTCLLGWSDGMDHWGSRSVVRGNPKQNDWRHQSVAHALETEHKLPVFSKKILKKISSDHFIADSNSESKFFSFSFFWKILQKFWAHSAPDSRGRLSGVTTLGVLGSCQFNASLSWVFFVSTLPLFFHVFFFIFFFVKIFQPKSIVRCWRRSGASCGYSQSSTTTSPRGSIRKIWFNESCDTMHGACYTFVMTQPQKSINVSFFHVGLIQIQWKDTPRHLVGCGNGCQVSLLTFAKPSWNRTNSMNRWARFWIEFTNFSNVWKIPQFFIVVISLLFCHDFKPFWTEFSLKNKF